MVKLSDRSQWEDEHNLSGEIMIKIHHAHWDAIYIPESYEGGNTMLNIMLSTGI